MVHMLRRCTACAHCRPERVLQGGCGILRCACECLLGQQGGFGIKTRAKKRLCEAGDVLCSWPGSPKLVTWGDAWKGERSADPCSTASVGVGPLMQALMQDHQSWSLPLVQCQRGGANVGILMQEVGFEAAGGRQCSRGWSYTCRDIVMQVTVELPCQEERRGEKWEVMADGMQR